MPENNQPTADDLRAVGQKSSNILHLIKTVTGAVLVTLSIMGTALAYGVGYLDRELSKRDKVIQVVVEKQQEDSIAIERIDTRQQAILKTVDRIDTNIDRLIFSAGGNP